MERRRAGCKYNTHRPPKNNKVLKYVQVCYMPRNAKKRRSKHDTVRCRQGESKYVTNRATVETYRKYETMHTYMQNPRPRTPTCIGGTTVP